MRLLLDTHVFLWLLNGSPRLRRPAKAMIESADTVFISAISPR